MPTLNEWIKIYENKTKEKFYPKEGFKLFYLPSRGFCEIKIIDNPYMLQIYQLCGDGHFWKDFADCMAQGMNIKIAGSLCIRNNILAYIRFWGYKIIKKEPLSDGSFVYIGLNKQGKKARFSPVFMHKDKTRRSYMVTWEV